MPSRFLLHPLTNVAEAVSGVTYREVIHPSPENRVDQPDHPLQRLGSESPEDVLQRAEQSGPLLQFGRVIRPPHLIFHAWDSTKIESKKAKAFPFRKIHRVTLIFIDHDLESIKLLPESLVDGPNQPKNGS